MAHQQGYAGLTIGPGLAAYQALHIQSVNALTFGSFLLLTGLTR